MLRKLMVALITTVGISAPALAADLPTFTPPPPPPQAPSFIWGGLYVGGFGAYILAKNTYAVGATIGYNFDRHNRFIVGIEGQLGAAFPNGPIYGAGINTRLGTVFRDRVLLYGEAGIATILPYAGAFTTNAGVGVEVATNSRFTVFGEGKAIFGGGGYQGTMLQAGFNLYH